MKIALIGTGRMGAGIERLAPEYDFHVVAKINSQKQDWDQMQLADLWIDFSQSEQVLEHVKKAVSMKKNLLIGTTNWENTLPQVSKLVASSSIGVLALANCSLGLFIFLESLKKATHLLAQSPLTFSMKGQEVHHTKKKDAPSGTAKEISHILSSLSGLPLAFESQREGEEPGFHQVSFDTPFETFTFSHRAKSREGFLKGALEAALWLHNRKGFYTLQSYLEEVFCET